MRELAGRKSVTAGHAWQASYSLGQVDLMDWIAFAARLKEWRKNVMFAQVMREIREIRRGPTAEDKPEAFQARARSRTVG